jgi:A/G-specific adenine glycosylase
VPDPQALARSRRALRSWFEPRRRAYPWRGVRDPYRVLVSEVMLQQTQASRVVSAYRAFLRRFPSIRSLASAPRRDVLVAWDGLGYNRRAVALAEAARVVVHDHGGRVPADPAALQALPGIGPYTAAAVASMAFGVPVAAIDTNVRRIVARVFAGCDADAAATSDVRALADAWLDRADPGAWNEALMDLGREVCRPRPRCEVCPLRSVCRFAVSDGVPTPQRRRPERFEGSSRQARGAVVRALRTVPSASLAGLARSTGLDAERIAEAVAALDTDGVVAVRRGRVRLAE